MVILEGDFRGLLIGDSFLYFLAWLLFGSVLYFFDRLWGLGRTISKRLGMLVLGILKCPHFSGGWVFLVWWDLFFDKIGGTLFLFWELGITTTSDLSLGVKMGSGNKSVVST